MGGGAVDLVSWLIDHLADEAPVWMAPGEPPRTADALREAVAARAVAMGAFAPGEVVWIATPSRWAQLVEVLAVVRAGGVAMLARPGHDAPQGIAARLEEGVLTRADAPILAHPDAALIVETSGSSDTPRRVMLGQAGVQANVSGILSYLPLEPGMRVGLHSPLHYSYGLIGQCMTALRAGACLVPLPRGPWIAQVVESMRAAKVCGLSTVPSTLGPLVEALDDGQPAPPLRWLASAGAPLPVALASKLRRALPTTRLFNQYGMTEAGPRLCAREIFGIDNREKHDPLWCGDVGRPLPDTSIKILDDAGDEAPVGARGRVVVRGPSLMLGCWQDQAATDRAMTPQGLETGDVGALDASGRLHLSGRSDDLVQIGGERVSMNAVSDAIASIEGVVACVVRPVEDDAFGARLVACVVAPTRDDRALRAAVRGLQGQQKMHARRARLVRMDALPLTATGKVDHRALDAHIQGMEQA